MTERSSSIDTEIAIEADHEALALLLDTADEMKPNLPELKDITARTKKTSFLAAGAPEITQLILALGSSGAIYAVQSILRAYFAKRPHTELVLRRKGINGSTTVVVRNADDETLQTFFKNFDSDKRS
ncbi:hypothetical protein ACVDG8_016005 [Mesorhizobium sp. ORM8.1]